MQPDSGARRAEEPDWALRLRGSGLSPTPFPRGIEPMLPALVAEPFDREGWLFEVKWDGYRAIAEVEHGEARMLSRRGLLMNRHYPSLVQALQSLSHEAVLDGEIVVLDDQGRARFQLLQNLSDAHLSRLVYYAFDLLYLDGYDLRERPLRERKDLLTQVLPQAANIRYSDHVWDRGRAFFAATAEHGIEGMVGKDGGSRYVSGRSRLWQKVKHVRQQEAIIGGFTVPATLRGGIAALVLGVYERRGLAYVGHVGTGFDEATVRLLLQRLIPLVSTKSPFGRPIARTNYPFRRPSGSDVSTIWVRPELVCEVKFAEWTQEGLMRHPVFLGLRQDVRPEDVRREVPAG